MLRITDATTAENMSGDAVLLRLEGQVTGPWVEELRRVCAEALGNNGHRQRHLVIDLANVSFLDADGIALFRELADRRIVFANSSAFIAQQLQGVADVIR